VGILKEWLMRALNAALAGRKATLLKKHLEQTALLASQCEKILIEAREGEARLNEDETSRSRLRNLLGIGEAIRTPAGHHAQASLDPRETWLWPETPQTRQSWVTRAGVCLA
jgi:hypothetical protein